jgi:hypothetical protein
MRSYNRSSRSGGGRYGGGGFRRRDSGRREMHKAVCDECGNNCFERKEGGSSRRPNRRSSGRAGFEKRDNTNKQLLEQVSSLNSKLDRILKVLEYRVEKKPASKKTAVKKEEVKAASKDKKVKAKKASKKAD